MKVPESRDLKGDGPEKVSFPASIALLAVSKAFAFK